MIGESMYKEADNVSSSRHTQKLLRLDQKGTHRVKTSALGDVQNILHSRPLSFATQNSSLKSVQGKQTVLPAVTNKNPWQIKCSKSEKADNSMNEQYEDMDFEYHNHFLCEQADEICLNNFLCEYKCTERQIETLAKMGKNFNLGTVNFLPPVVPCDDIAFEENMYKDLSINLDDLLEDFVLPEVPAI